MFAATEATMMFNAAGTALLVHTQCDVDHSNSSYYGASGLFLMTADGSISAPVEQSKEGPIHDVKWSPLGDRCVLAILSSGKEVGWLRLNTIPTITPYLSSCPGRFVVSAGTMPCHTTLYNAKGELVYQFGAAHRNTIAWSPHGRFLALAGFGNLAGEVDFFDTV
jgi:translation initiation factor 2A